MGNVELEYAKVIVKEAVLDKGGGILHPEIVLNYGNFLQVTIDFFLIAFIIFLVIKLFNRLKRKAENPAEEEVPTPANIQLLSEIRDLLRERSTMDK